MSPSIIFDNGRVIHRYISGPTFEIAHRVTSPLHQLTDCPIGVLDRRSRTIDTTILQRAPSLRHLSSFGGDKRIEWSLLPAFFPAFKLCSSGRLIRFFVRRPVVSRAKRRLKSPEPFPSQKKEGNKKKNNPTNTATRTIHI